MRLFKYINSNLYDGECMKIEMEFQYIYAHFQIEIETRTMGKW
jgi:hypothetical protein